MLTKEKSRLRDQPITMAGIAFEQYFTMPKINPGNGRCEYVVISTIENFLKQQLCPNLDESEQNHQNIQNGLWSLCNNDQALLCSQAALALRCYVVNSAKCSIDNLVNKFASQLGYSRQNFLCQDLYPCVIDDEGRHISIKPGQATQSLSFDCLTQVDLDIKSGSERPTNVHKPFSLNVLSTYQPHHRNGESLRNWTHRLVYQHKSVKEMLNEYNICISSPWQFLSGVSPKQLQIIETEFSYLSNSCIDEHIKILTALRSIHQSLRLRSGGNISKNVSYSSKLESLKLKLESDNIFLEDTYALEVKLKEITKVLRQYQTKVFQPNSSNIQIDPGSPTELEDLLPHQASTGLDALAQQEVLEFQFLVQQKFYPLYLNQRKAMLDHSISNSVQQRFNFLSKQSPERARTYLLALDYFFCQGLSMTEIAQKINFNAQYRVSRLLILSSNISKQSSTSPDLISCSMLCMAQQLRTEFNEWLHTSTTIQQQKLLEEDPSLLWQLLDSSIQDLTKIFKEARAEIAHPKHARDSLFSKRLSNILNNKYSSFLGRNF